MGWQAVTGCGCAAEYNLLELYKEMTGESVKCTAYLRRDRDDADFWRWRQWLFALGHSWQRYRPVREREERREGGREGGKEGERQTEQPGRISYV